jgi:hypothetical protein
MVFQRSSLVTASSTYLLSQCGQNSSASVDRNGLTFEANHVLAESLLALLAEEGHLDGLLQGVVGHLVVAVRTIEPLLAAGGADSGLDVQDVLAHLI